MPPTDSQDNARVAVNGRDYRRPTRPTVVITIDGCQPAYLDDALERGLMPRLTGLLADSGSYHLGTGADALVDQPEQRLDRDRRRPVDARHPRQPLPRAGRLRGPVDRPVTPARPDDSRRDAAGRRAGAGGDGEGQAAPPAGRGRRPRRSAPSGPASWPAGARHRRRAGRWSAEPSRRSTTGTSSHYAMEIGLAVHRICWSATGRARTCSTSR